MTLLVFLILLSPVRFPPLLQEVLRPSVAYSCIHLCLRYGKAFFGGLFQPLPRQLFGSLGGY